ncbi:N-acetylmuramoyl-L-alanine amidase family protein [Paenibacillus sp. 481]|uniref:N-acetylmuramoyl-L-alanine amidase family protein n=1 Tax=Paenibacillus sp. 481 TaxID=2835869 RepID=UPI001E47D9C2|nr:N-acetylmuramoyl-L-alanine amidase [Paenibacillus sp. 481]UHA76051.1 N-acetylmuramoyl-L-alanine amidase [Paenibacillus sp. 481]
MKKGFFPSLCVLIFICLVAVIYIFGEQIESVMAQQGGQQEDNRRLDGKTIVIDPGHGGKDVGSIGQAGTYEKDVALLTAKHIQRELAEQTGATVLLTRDQDETVQLPERVAMAESANADLYISLHYDAYVTKDVSGITTYYHKQEDRQLADILHQSLFQQDLQTKDRGVRQGDYYVIRENRSPAVLLELGYISNANDEQQMNSAQFQKKVTKAIVDGVADYLTL